jgi:hypothetical protein
MPVVIKADCPVCGVVRLGATDVTVRVCADDSSGAYCFRCAECGSGVSHEASLDVCDLLVSAGVARVDWRWPEELGERPGGPQFTTDDLLDFHLLLGRDTEWSEELAAFAPDAP